jgi:hypothetical protein
MMETDPNSIVYIVKEDGVKDLQPMLVKSTFAKALKAERTGNEAEALELLDKAVGYAQTATA